MLNTSQSVALDKYLEITDNLLNETNQYIDTLESHGTLNISGKQLKMFIGHVLKIKNQISENLYIFDSSVKQTRCCTSIIQRPTEAPSAASSTPINETPLKHISARVLTFGQNHFWAWIF